MNKLLLLSWGILLAIMGPAPLAAFELKQPECLVSAKAGGGMELSCQLIANSLLAAGLLDTPMQIKYKTGGIGAVAYNHVIGVRNADPQLIVAASSGSVLNIATQKFGHYNVGDVRWLGAVAADYGVVAVRLDAPWNSLTDLVETLRQAPHTVNIGGSGSVGSQDWMKAALLVQETGSNPKQIRYAGFEGPKDAAEALVDGFIDVFPGDAAELKTYLSHGKIKILAVLADHRLPGLFSGIPTAQEQGYPVDWTIWRGFYMGPQVSEDSYQGWLNILKRLLKTTEFQKERETLGFYPFTMLGQDFTEFIERSAKKHKELTKSIGLIQ